MNGPTQPRENRTEMLRVRLSPTEKTTVERRARAAGVAVSELVRRRVADRRELVG